MNEMTAANAAENLERLANDFKEVGTPGNAKILRYAASILRRVASGELAPVIHAHWEEVEPGHDILFQCSKCGRIVSTSWGSCEDEDTHGNNGCDPTEEWLNCPTCNAVMDEPVVRQTDGGKDDEDAE